LFSPCSQRFNARALGSYFAAILPHPPQSLLQKFDPN
jgi:hypothetical protein